MRRGRLVPCGQCGACIVNRRRIWTVRLMLERYLHPASWFVTLTYADEHLPPDGSVSRREVQLFLKRLRKRGENVRYFAVGEYGERFGRPHYHLMLYGLRDVGYVVRNARYVLSSPNVEAAWPFGGVHIGELNATTAAYVTGYVSKKWTRRTPDGRAPEFSQPSLRPGIGAGVADSLAQFWNTEIGVKELVVRRDVSKTVRVDGKVWPLGRYMVQKVRVAAGYGASPPDDVVRALLVRDLFISYDSEEVSRLKELGDVACVKAKEVVRQSNNRRIL